MPPKSSIKAGQIYATRSYGDIEVLEYKDANSIKVRFLDTGTEDWFRSQKIQNGSIRDKFKPTLHGVGFMGGYTKDDRYKQAYQTWSSIITRCYDKESSTYRFYGAKGCFVCEDWHNFANFQEWYNENCKEGYQVDKDIVFREYKIYSPDTCSVVPNYVNKAIIDTQPSREGLPIGVSKIPSGKYIARVNTRDERVYLGTFKTAKEAYECYRRKKKDYLDFLAIEQFLLGNIDANVYCALQEWEIRTYEETV